MAYRRERAIRDQNASVACGYNKGKNEKQKEIVQKILEKNMSIEDIIEITGISRDEIDKI